jgi:hypothetical protein
MNRSSSEMARPVLHRLSTMQYPRPRSAPPRLESLSRFARGRPAGSVLECSHCPLGFCSLPCTSHSRSGKGARRRTRNHSSLSCSSIKWNRRRSKQSPDVQPLQASLLSDQAWSGDILNPNRRRGPTGLNLCLDFSPSARCCRGSEVQMPMCYRITEC